MTHLFDDAHPTDAPPLASTIEPPPGDLRAWHIPQIPGTPFYIRVADVHAAKQALALLSAYDEFLLDENIRGDFASVQGIERYEESGHNPGDPPFDWFEVDLDD